MFIFRKFLKKLLDFAKKSTRIMLKLFEKWFIATGKDSVNYNEW